ncbi:zinc finger BED domain-containing protein 4-like [Aricia agestis]|uniref:zinc finger BED domain-containing protein 4-like n=1 Tax=Aricia agestis TaxID=91739 RepID=UPI001C20C394|nr:zinc finger BED domain-containing protein 4-like [Aricia agestis]XP_041986804.1 zinc finger BED domain-containing protein 4-like [Aricia agestis]
MPRRISNAVHRYFDFDKSAKFSACKECGNKMKGNHASNLLNHLRLKHETKYQEVLAINENTSRVDKLKPNKNRKDEEKEKKRERLLQCCVKLIAIHGRPFSLLEDNAFKEIKALICADFVEEANCKKIKTLIAEKANTIKEKIVTEVAQTLISVKMDSATCMDRQFVGINIQYIKNSKIVVRNLAIKEIFCSQTSENLKCTLLEVLADFRIDLYNIYSLTTDNGANYLKISKLLNEEINNDNETGTENDGDEDEDELVYHSDDYAYSLEHFNATFLNDNEQERMVEIRQIACAAHTLQLCIKDVLKNDYETLIEKCRNVVRILRRPLMKLKIKLEKFKKPILDCTTRWFSTYYMLERLKELKTFCDSCNDICEIISENEWIKINHIIISLEPSKEATVRLQAEQLTVGDFFSIWTICKAKTEKINLPLAQDVVVSMTRREKNLLEGKAFLLGIFLDPRLKLILSEDERQTAKCYIRGVHQQMLEVEKRAQAITREEEQAATSNSLLSPGCSRDLTSLSNISSDSFQSDLQSLEDILSLTQRVRAPLDTISLDLDYYLSEYLAAPRLAVTESSIEYWSLKSHRLAKLALIALAAPITQVTVERLFSVLKFILTPSRNRLLDETLKNIILIKSNKDLLE